MPTGSAVSLVSGMNKQGHREVVSAYRLGLDNLAVDIVVGRGLGELEGDLENAARPPLHQNELTQSSLEH